MPPATDELLRQFANRLRLAAAPEPTTKQVAEKAGMAPMTLHSLGRGGSGVTMASTSPP